MTQDSTTEYDFGYEDGFAAGLEVDITSTYDDGYQDALADVHAVFATWEADGLDERYPLGLILEAIEDIIDVSA